MTTGIEKVPETIRPRIEYFLMLERVLEVFPAAALEAATEKEVGEPRRSKAGKISWVDYFLLRKASYEAFSSSAGYDVIKNVMAKYKVDRKKYFAFLEKRFNNSIDLIKELFRLEVNYAQTPS